MSDRFLPELMPSGYPVPDRSKKLQEGFDAILNEDQRQANIRQATRLLNFSAEIRVEPVKPEQDEAEQKDC